MDNLSHFTILSTGLTARSLRTVLSANVRILDSRDDVERDEPVVRFSTPDYVEAKTALDAAYESYRVSGHIPPRP